MYAVLVGVEGVKMSVMGKTGWYSTGTEFTVGALKTYSEWCCLSGGRKCPGDASVGAAA